VFAPSSRTRRVWGSIARRDGYGNRGDAALRRRAHEKTLAELKSQVTFEAVPTNDRYANAAWQRISALTLNLIRGFQIDTGAARRPRTLKRTFAYVLQSLATLRFERALDRLAA
jgi:hypothetical protein